MNFLKNLLEFYGTVANPNTHGLCADVFYQHSRELADKITEEGKKAIRKAVRKMETLNKKEISTP
jgi:hypothetical protein